MNVYEFEKYIESLGFEFVNNADWFVYEKYIIDVWFDHYKFYDGDKWCDCATHYTIDDLTPLKKIERNIKLKKILG